LESVDPARHFEHGANRRRLAVVWKLKSWTIGKGHNPVPK
jgi:hypothetical protein